MSLSQLESPVQYFDPKGHKPVLNIAKRHLVIEWLWNSSAQIPYHLVIQFPFFIYSIQHKLACHATSVLTISTEVSMLLDMFHYGLLTIYIVVYFNR